MKLTYARWRAEPVFGQERDLGPSLWLAAFSGDPQQGATEVSRRRTLAPTAAEYWSLRNDDAETFPVLVNTARLQTAELESGASHCALLDRKWGGTLVVVVQLDRPHGAGVCIRFLPGTLTISLERNVETVSAALQREQGARLN